MRAFPFTDVRSVWMDGELVDFEEAKVHVLTHALHYGSGIFEGIRCYDTPEGPATFRLREHMDRFLASAKVFRMDLGHTRDDLCRATIEVLRANSLGTSYIRPVAFRGFSMMGVNPLKNPVVVAIAAWPTRAVGGYLGKGGAEGEGVDACVSSWRRLSPGSLPPTAKATANYLNSQLIKMEAETNGYNEGIGLDDRGNVSEGSAENLFAVQDGVLLTPPLSASILAGITRDCVLTLARDLGITVREQDIPRGSLYTCDELFFTGTAVEITAIRSVDRIPVGNGKPGEMTRLLARELAAISWGEMPDRHGWRELVRSAAAAPEAVAEGLGAGQAGAAAGS